MIIFSEWKKENKKIMMKKMPQLKNYEEKERNMNGKELLIINASQVNDDMLHRWMKNSRNSRTRIKFILLDYKTDWKD